jgi:hypothetical protein
MGIAFRFVLGFLVYSGWAYMQTDGVSCTVQATWDSDTHRVTGLVCILRVVAAHSLRIITFFGTQNSALIPTSPCCCSVRLEPPWSLSTSEKKAEACDGLSRLLPTFIEIPHRSMERHVTLRRRFLSYPSSSSRHSSPSTDDAFQSRSPVVFPSCRPPDLLPFLHDGRPRVPVTNRELCATPTQARHLIPLA